MKSKRQKKRNFFSYDFFPKNRRGFLLAEETLKVILAVIAIGFLVYLLFSLYKAGKDSKDLELAKESLSFLQQEMNAEKTSIDIYNPEGWNIGMWPHPVLVSGSLGIGAEAEMQYPNSCSNLGWESCVCICEDNNEESCDENGACFNNEKKFNINGGNIEINNPPIILKVDYQNKMISKA